MNITAMKGGLTRPFHRALLHIQKRSPEMLVVAGVAGMIGATAWACYSSTKIEYELEEIRENIKDVKELFANADKKEKAKQLTLVYLDAAKTVAKLYGPPLILGISSVLAILGSHKMMATRNAAAVAAYKTAEKAYEQYRDRVRKEFGEEKDLEFHRGTKKEVVPVKQEDGTTVPEEILLNHESGLSPYARIFDANCPDYKSDISSNMYYLKTQQNYFNMLLQNRGHVFLSEVYDALGFERTPESIIMGWLRNSDNLDGDGFVDFGIFNVMNQSAGSVINGLERQIVLDFNVDGVIFDMI